MFLAKSFFSLEEFAHETLWKREDPVWMALLLLKEYMRQKKFRIEIEIPAGVFLQNSEWISIEEGTTIEPGVFIQGPCIIGKNCTIRHGAYLREWVLTGDGCHIGHSTEIKHSILLNRAAATHFGYVGDSILGNEVNLGAGVKCANLRLDRGEVKVAHEGKRIKTGLRKLGAIVGDRAQIGCNCVLNPGTLMGKESFSYPLMSLKGVIPARSQINEQGVQPIEQKILETLLFTTNHS